MNYYVYIISTKRKKKKIFYTGYTNNLNKRISLHNSGKGAKFTRGNFWKLVYKKKFIKKKEALIYEHFLKKNRLFKYKLVKKKK